MKTRICEFCKKDITAGWPVLKIVCDSPVCREKLRLKRIRKRKENDDARRYRKRVARVKGLKCEMCGGPIPPEQRKGKTICLQEKCMDKYFDKMTSRKSESAKNWYWKNKKPVAPEPKPKRLVVVVPKKHQPWNGFSQKIYDAEQKALQAKKKTCLRCGKKFGGPNHSYCDACFYRNTQIADSHRTEGAYGGAADGDGAKRTFSGVY